MEHVTVINCLGMSYHCMQGALTQQFEIIAGK